MIVKNAVYQYVNDKKRIRIIYICSTEDIYAYVDIETNLAVPTLENITALEQDIETNNVVEIIDPFSKLFEDNNLSDVVLKKRDDN